MNIEAFSYSALTALIGMGVVSFFLIILSLLMVAIRVVFDSYRPFGRTSRRDQSGDVSAESYVASPDGERSTIGGGSGGALVKDAHGIPRWAIAGALAYLVVEDEEYQPVVGTWALRARRSGRTDET